MPTMNRRYHLRIFGCQMNQHDAEQIENLLHHADYRPVPRPEDADLVLIHTCSVRDKAEQKLYSELGALVSLRRTRPDLVIGVGGCVAQQVGAGLLTRFPELDFVFGSQNLRHLPAMVSSARARSRSLRVDYEDDREARFQLPERHPEFQSASPGRAFVTVMEGCDLFCTFCVVPYTRGREVSRSSRAILDEVQMLGGRGVVEITLLGQTVNAYGRPRPGMAPGETSFAELLRGVAGIREIERVRFTSPHPLFVTPDLIDCYANLPELCPHIHLPVQSGSSRVLSAMNRRYDREEYLRLVERLRRARPELALTTDLIVGFPGETPGDFEQTLSLVREVEFVDSFSFVYSPRPGTAALRRDVAPVPAEEARERLQRLQLLQRELTLRAHHSRVGSDLAVLVGGPSRRGGAQQQGRCPQNRVVNFVAEPPLDPGRVVEIHITGATPHSMLGVPAASRASMPLPLV